jgi:hypothetical protein
MSGRKAEKNMGKISESFRRKYDRWVNKSVLERIDLQSQLIFDAHWTKLLASPQYDDPLRLERFGFRTYSQNDEDGIIQEIFNRVGVEHSTFVEFGVEDGTQNNSALLLLKGWRGLWIECNPRHFRKINNKFAAQLGSGQLQVANEFVTRDNINDLIAAANLPGVDCISIDVDGNDYWIWQVLTIKPRVVVMEFNGKFRPPLKWVMDYNATHTWDGSDYHGASLQSLADLGREKGYTLVGCSLAGINAFFVRNDLVQQRFADCDVATLYNPPRFYAGSFLLSGHRKMGGGPFQSL